MENLDHLKERDFTIIVDRSGSMAEPMGGKSNKSRWRGCEESVEAIAARLQELDSDGITVYEFNGKFSRYDNTTADKVKDVFKKDPNGSTDLAGVLNHAFSDYLHRKAKGQTKLNGELMLVVTDGRPDDENAVAREITNVTKRLDNGKELALIFVQVGDDQHAATFLNELDDKLEGAGAKYDIVSCLPLDKVGDQPLTDVLMKAITEAKVA